MACVYIIINLVSLKRMVLAKKRREKARARAKERKKKRASEKERERERATERETEREREHARVCGIAMGWLRSVGSIKLQVSFAEYCLFYRALWQ